MYFTYLANLSSIRWYCTQIYLRLFWFSGLAFY